MNENFTDCFENFCKSRANEPESDPCIWVVRCERAVIEKTYMERPRTATLKQICLTECPIYLNSRLTAARGDKS